MIARDTRYANDKRRNVVDDIHDQYYRQDMSTRRDNNNWIPLLIIPLLALGALAAYPFFSSNNSTQQPNVVAPSGDTNVQYGVGGGPVTPTVSPTMTPTRTPTPDPSVTEQPGGNTMDLNSTVAPSDVPLE